MSSPTTRRARCCKRVMQSNVGRGRIRKEPTGEAWWADVLAGPRARKRERRTDLAVKQAFYQLADERRETILVACSKCDWRAAFSRDELIASHSADYAMPNLLNHLAALAADYDKLARRAERRLKEAAKKST